MRRGPIGSHRGAAAASRRPAETPIRPRLSKDVARFGALHWAAAADTGELEAGRAAARASPSGDGEMDRRSFVGLAAAAAASSVLPRMANAQAPPKAKNVVLVHGLFADG